MSYLHDRRDKNRKWKRLAVLGVILLVLFFARRPIFNAFSYLGHTVFNPVFRSGNAVARKFEGIGAFFKNHHSLSVENQTLRSKLDTQTARIANYDSMLAENNSLKETLGRGGETPLLLAAILAKPNQSPYDTLIIDVGSDKNIKAGSTVFANGAIPVGRIAEVYLNSSKVVLFSNSGEKTKVVINDLFMDIVGRGGNNFEMILPRDFTVAQGDQVVLPGITPYVVGVVETIISDPRDAFQKALLVSPVNIQALKFVQIAQ